MVRVCSHSNMLSERESGFGREAAIGFLGALLAFLAVLPAGPAWASSPARSTAQATASAAFSLSGSHGFSVGVESVGGEVRIVASEGAPPVPTFSRGGTPRVPRAVNGAASVYSLRASSSPRRIEASLGGLGRISVRFHPSGRTRVTRLDELGAFSCGGRTRIVRHLGTFVGTVEFQGEGGYTAVEARRAQGSVGTPLPAACAAAARPAGKVVLRAFNRGAGTRFQTKTTAGGVAFTASWHERLESGVVVSRRAYTGGPPDAFAFAADLSAARVSPPAPFSGSARYRAAAGGSRWSGSLRATFPGRAIELTGPGFRAGLGAVG